MSKEEALTRKFWNYDECLLERMEEEPDPIYNKQLLPDACYYKSEYSPCEKDYQRALLSLPVRGLQDKTQVYPLDKEHFVRSRLTHSLEVALNASQIFDEIISFAVKAQDNSKKEVINDLSEIDKDNIRYALMAASLLHDCGNPPFGHHGEEIIKSWFGNHCNNRSADFSSVYDEDLVRFDGNANSLRMAFNGCALFDGRRMNPTLLTLGALIKYPWHSNRTKANSSKFNFFGSDDGYIDSFCEKCDALVAFDEGKRSRISLVMEASDDISYATSDFEDAFRKNKFSINEVLGFMLREWERKRRGQNADKMDEFHTNAFVMALQEILLLAIIAGEPADIQMVIEYVEKMDIALSRLLDSSGNGYLKGQIDYLLKDDIRSLADAEYEHVYSYALRECFDLHLDQRQKSHLQETYVSRWVDTVRKWLVYAAASSVGNYDNKFDGRNSYWMYGTHQITIEILKSVLAHFVYSDSENLKQNVHAQTVLGGLLDLFIPAVEKCADETIFTGDCGGEEDETCIPERLFHSNRLSPTDLALIKLIPLRYRLDFKHRYSSEWDTGRLLYELDMLVLDFLTSLPDDYAVRLYEELLI